MSWWFQITELKHLSVCILCDLWGLLHGFGISWAEAFWGAKCGYLTAEGDHLNGLSSPLKSPSEPRIFYVFWDFHLLLFCASDFEKYLFMILEMEVFMVLHGTFMVEVPNHILSCFHCLGHIRTHVRIPILKHFIESHFLLAFVTVMFIMNQTLGTSDVLPVSCLSYTLRMTKQPSRTFEYRHQDGLLLAVNLPAGLTVNTVSISDIVPGKKYTKRHSYCIILNTCVQLVTGFY